ncbi:inactive serine/threonine-protein kinase 19-like [Haliotis asinina]|uniref:inactive serine/threonine-protein kinase 19-like n=1 Tax=Haliotis asinina TaxID=109174 RepID=UPI003531B959
MSRKRTLLPDIYKHKKKCVRPAEPEENGDFNDNALMNGLPTDTEASLIYLKNLFPGDKFDDRLPPIIFKHQLYSIVKNRTTVDKHVGDLRSSGEIKVFKLGADANDLCVVFAHDYETHILHVMKDLHVHNHIIEKFLRVVKNCNDVSLDKDTLMKDFRFKDEEITQLVKSSVLTVRDVGSWWLSIPNAGVFMKNFMRGRKALLTMIRKCKYREILQQDLEQRKWPKLARLGILYHIHDVIGSDLVESVQTTSGNLLRLKD